MPPTDENTNRQMTGETDIVTNATCGLSGLLFILCSTSFDMSACNGRGANRHLTLPVHTRRLSAAVRLREAIIPQSFRCLSQYPTPVELLQLLMGSGQGAGPIINPGMDRGSTSAYLSPTLPCKPRRSFPSLSSMVFGRRLDKRPSY
jgi:hypothetical protein